MGLDDRLRSAHQRRLSDTRRRLADSDHNYDEPVDPPIPLRRSSRVLAIAAVVAVLAGGTLAVTSPWDDDGSINAELGPAGEQTSLGQSAADGDEQTESDSSVGADESAAEGATVSVPVQQGTSTPASPDTTPGSTSATTPGSTSDTTPVSTAASTPESTAAPTTGASSTGPPTDVGVESDVCPSGRRATLERAELRYIGENEGWSRLDDLVDEQDGPFYFNGWEPGYPNDVTVELELAEPALAQDIRIAQDPYTPVNGLIAIGVVGEGVNLEMSGTGGWRVHNFGEPRLVGSFTINRQNSEANVMEVLICLASDR